MYVDVALPISLYQTFIYKLDLDINPDSVIGRRVLVPLNMLKYYGIVVDVSPSKPDYLDESQIKDVIEIDDFQVFDNQGIKIIKSISEYYISPIGITAYYFLPNKLKGKFIDDIVGKVFTLNHENLEAVKLTDTQKRLIELFNKKSELSYKEILEYSIKKQTILSLIKKGILVPIDVSIKTAVKNPNQKVEMFLSEKEKELDNRLYILSNLSFDLRVKYYLKLFYEYIKNSKSVLIVFPSIHAGVKFYDYISKYFKDVYIYNDGISENKQFKIFQSIREKPCIVIGTLSSLLLPIKNLSLLIVEYESSESYKSLQTPKFDVKRVSYLIHKYKNIPVVFADTLSSLENFILLNSKKAKIIKKADIPKFKLEIYPFKGLRKSIEKLISIVKNYESSLIVVNKSYLASFVHCKRCGFEWLCDRCQVPLKVVVKKGRKVLKCPECNKVIPYSKRCPDCDNILKEEGFGSYRVLEELEKRLSVNVSLLEDDIDTPVKVISTLESKFILKKFDVVVNLYPDFLKTVEDYRANEKFYRAVFIPAFYVKDRYILFSNIDDKEPVFQILQGKGHIEDIYRYEIEFRRKYKYPPAVKLTKVEAFFKRKDYSQSLKQFLIENFSNEEIVFQIYSGKYFKVILNTDKKDVLKKLYETFSQKAKISIDVNTKDI
ncbi:MAG: hypothetical protein ABWJ98_01295 [Hydrogenothermaceae bacterium]